MHMGRGACTGSSSVKRLTPVSRMPTQGERLHTTRFLKNSRMTRVLWTDSARADLRAIHAFIARDSHVYAQRTMDRIRKAVKRLSRFPASGAMVQGRSLPELREILVGNYRVIYRIGNTAVEIIAVVHSARLLRDGE